MRVRALCLCLVLLMPATTARALERDGVCVATFNASLNRGAEGELIQALSTPDDPQAQAVAEIIQRVRPDILLINEFDYDADRQAVGRFQANYLGVSQNGAAPIHYPYVFIAPSNTGVPSGQDLDNDGSTDSPGDAFGFGFFPGQFAMVLFSKYPILGGDVRTFRRFLWQDMPGALLPDDPETTEPQDWYSADELGIVRLSSKSHWDVPVLIGRRTLHVLASHPTPPVFDDPPQFPEGVDFNGRRNHDEIRFWADYVQPEHSGYIYDDQGGVGGLDEGEAFVIMGDQNADPFDGDSTMNAIRQLLEVASIKNEPVPASEGGEAAAVRQGGINLEHAGNPAYDTADFSDAGPGNLRVDYVLPSTGLRIENEGVFWPTTDDALFRLVEDGEGGVVSSDHRLVWIDVALDRKRRPRDKGFSPDTRSRL